MIERCQLTSSMMIMETWDNHSEASARALLGLAWIGPWVGIFIVWENIALPVGPHHLSG